MEGRYILIFGLIVLVSAFLFWKLGETSAAKSLFVPIAITGLLFSGGGAYMMYSNNQRLADYKVSYESDSQAFIQSEKARVENFQSWYPKTRYIMAGIALIGIFLSVFIPKDLPRSIGAALLIVALTTYVIDHVSESRAEVYHKEIVKTLRE